MTTSFFIAVGESSGDMHGANLAKELLKHGDDVTISGIGGPLMKEAGVDLLADTTAFAAVGIIEALRHLPTYRKIMKDCVTFIGEQKPSAVILIDYPDFNLRLAERIQSTGVPIIYYISPQVWAWRKGRIHQIARLVRKMLVVFDFEKDIYNTTGLDVDFVGHPLLDALNTDQIPDRPFQSDCPVIGMLPGSREKEFSRLFPVMTEAARMIHSKYPGARFIASRAPTVDEAIAAPFIDSASDLPIEIRVGSTEDICREVDFALVASGTATLITGIFAVPMIMCYKVSPLSTLLLRWFIKIDSFALPNIVLGRDIIPEFLQSQATSMNLANQAIEWIQNPQKLTEIRTELSQIRDKLGGSGASKRAAEAILKLVSQEK